MERPSKKPWSCFECLRRSSTRFSNAEDSRVPVATIRVTPVERERSIKVLCYKEEMGHLVTVQNLLSLLGEKPHLDRQSYPAPPSYPFEADEKINGRGSLPEREMPSLRMRK